MCIDINLIVIIWIQVKLVEEYIVQNDLKC